MITNLQITNFKSLANISLPLKNLNILTGINGMGKSTLIQTLLLLRQSYVPNLIGRGINLKGALTGNLGLFNDVLYRNAKDDKIIFTIDINEKQYRWQFEKSPIEDMLQGGFPIINNPKIALFSDSKFQYISAGRITPNSSFSKLGEALAYKQFGINGEYAIQFLFERGTDNALFSDYKDEKSSESLPLINQVNYWLKYITPNVNLDIQQKSNSEYELRYKFLNSENISASYSANNSAFGLTFSLPIITSLLAAEKGDLLIFENPENDLHPAAQSMIGQLLAKAASAGVQIIVETHSDHILNGICLAINKGIIDNEMAKFFYFNKKNNEINTSIYDVPIKSNGRIDDSNLREANISGFYDQFNNDLKTILFSSSKK
ncbi:MAG: hypothetical protein A2046_07715 [Bacteroidetes bacterium GWA2_30_7]|nr:MAG: hypothetical protein A2046_07715 [Bacteroidetes bacterium GWA2_30_7]